MKRLVIVAFDISSDKIRRQAVKMCLKYGKRINKSVFECMVTECQFKNLALSLKTICEKRDSIVIIPICIKCYSKIVSFPRRMDSNVTVVKVLD